MFAVKRYALVQTLRSSTWLLLASVGLVGCAPQSFTLKYAPGFSSAGHKISVFGVKRNGLMSRTGWGALEPGVAAPFNAERCDVAYSESTFASTPVLAEAVDAYVRANGATDSLLDELAPTAKGDTIMLLTITGHAHAGSEHVGGSPSARAGGVGAMGGGRGGMGRGGRGGGGGMGRGMGMASETPRSSAGDDPFTVSALFFSVREHQSVALVQMSYSGARIDEALGEFRQKLEAEFPRSTCSGWDWSVPVDARRIRALNEL
jgi:hypothetical protein